jgi:hypothetical protein
MDSIRSRVRESAHQWTTTPMMGPHLALSLQLDRAEYFSWEARSSSDPL